MAANDELIRLLGKLTLEEKVFLLSGVDTWHTREIPRLGIGSIKVSRGGHRQTDCHWVWNSHHPLRLQMVHRVPEESLLLAGLPLPLSQVLSARQQHGRSPCCETWAVCSVARPRQSLHTCFWLQQFVVLEILSVEGTLSVSARTLS